MELLCPSCQRKLTIPDQYAGMQMKCPLCNNPFTAPALAPVPAGAVVANAPPPPPPAPPSRAPVPPVTGAPPQPPPTWDAEKVEVQGSAVPPLPSGDYAHHASIHVSPQVLQWVPVACLFVSLILACFTWIGIEPGGVPLATQNGLEAAVGWVSVDPELSKDPAYSTYKGAVELTSASGLLIAYLILEVLVLTLAAASVAVTLPQLPVKVPPAAQNLVPLRWAVVGAGTLLLVVFLFLHLFFGFSLENRAVAGVDSEYGKALAAARGGDPKTSEHLQRLAQVRRGVELEALTHTTALTLVVVLDLVALIVAGLILWIDLRKQRPLPRIDVLW